MNSYFIQRIIPFAIFTTIIEFIGIVLLSCCDYENIDFSVFSIIKTFGVLILTTCVSFLFMIIPYMFYLLILPKNKQNSRLDRTITITMYSIFVFVNIFEEAASQVFWEEFSSAFNFIAVDYLVYTNEVIANIEQSYPIYWILGALFLTTLIVVMLSKKFLFPKIQAPVFKRRFFEFILYIIVCFLAYKNIDISNLEINQNRYNNELAKEGTYSLFSAFWKNEIAFEDFYPTQDTAKNLQILQKDFASKNVEFITPKKDITRLVNPYRPEKQANVIIILMESMSAKFLADKNLTPNLNALSQEGLYLSQVYATGTRSVRGIEALTLGVPPLPGMSIVRRLNNENLHTIGSIFKSKRYDTKWIYGGYGYFDNMNYFFENNDFEVVDRTVWNKDEITFANAWGSSDEDLFNKIIKEADKSYSEDKRFFDIALSISNHRPYSYPEGKIDLEPMKSKRSGGVKYADYAIGEFIKQAKTKPWFDNTVFVFVADHTAGASGKEELSPDDYHIPVIFYAPQYVKPRQIDTAVSQIDILPTLLGILDFNYESRFYGQDILQENYQSRYFISNYQKVGFIKDGVEVVLKPVKAHSISGEEKTNLQDYLDEAIAYYQQASDWQNNLKEEVK